MALNALGGFESGANPVSIGIIRETLVNSYSWHCDSRIRETSPPSLQSYTFVHFQTIKLKKSGSCVNKNNTFSSLHLPLG